MKQSILIQQASLSDIEAVVRKVLDDILDYGEYIPNKIEIVKKFDYQTLVKVKESLNFDNRIIIKILPKSN